MNAQVRILCWGRGVDLRPIAQVRILVPTQFLGCASSRFPTMGNVRAEIARPRDRKETPRSALNQCGSPPLFRNRSGRGTGVVWVDVKRAPEIIRPSRSGI